LVNPKQSLSSWKVICKPRVKGGLGIVDFQKKMMLSLRNVYINSTIRILRFLGSILSRTLIKNTRFLMPLKHVGHIGGKI
jgi:ubiquinone/menaquinone biosynthesis C-methylase UbiE